MPSYVIGNFFPGPGNILALNTVTTYGWKRGNPLFLGIFAGYYVVQLICAVFVYGVSTFLPKMLGVMKYIGAAYILWLAIHIAFSHPDGGNTEKSASFWKGFMLQFVNVKIYLFGITALTGYVTNYSTTLWVLILFELQLQPGLAQEWLSRKFICGIIARLTLFWQQPCWNVYIAS